MPDKVRAGSLTLAYELESLFLRLGVDDFRLRGAVVLRVESSLLSPFGDLRRRVEEDLLPFPLEDLVDRGGITAPPEMSIFMPSPTDISNLKISSLGRSRRKPLVGFGVVGTNTFVSFLPVTSSVSPDASLVIKPKTKQFGLGYSIKTTSLKTARFSLPNV